MYPISQVLDNINRSTFQMHNSSRRPNKLWIEGILNKLFPLSSKIINFLRSECISHEVNKVENDTIYLHQIIWQKIYSSAP